MSTFIDLSILFRYRNFGLLSLGQFVSFMGTMITGVALPYQIYHVTQSVLMVGLLSLAQLVPLLITALIGGVLADRHHRRTLLIISESLMSIGCIVFAWNATLPAPHVWVLFVVAMFMSAINGLHRPALESITQQIIDKKDSTAMGAFITFKYSICMIAGPAIGGLLISHFGLIATYLVDFGSFAISVIALSCMRNIPKPAAQENISALGSLVGGFKYAFSRQELIGTYLIDIVAMIFGMPSALFPAIAQAYGGVQTLGLLYAAPAVGAVVVSFVSGLAEKVKHHGRAIAISAALWGVSIIFFGLTHDLWIALLFLALAGAFDAISGIFRVSLWNETIPEAFRGRLAGIEMVSYMSGPKLGDTEAGLVAALFGISFSIISGGVLCVLGVSICCAFLPKFWRYRSVV